MLSSFSQSIYRTSHGGTGDPASLTRYTDRINPEPRAPLSMCSEEDGGEPVYSTLNRNEMQAYPPPPPLIHPPGQEAEIPRKDSRAPLLEDAVDGKTANQPFQIVQDNVAEPYQMAVSSRENLHTIGYLPEGRDLFQTTSSTSGSASSSQHVKLSHALSSSAVPSPTSSSSLSGQRIISVTNPMATTSNYEQIDRKYGVNDFSSSSPRLIGSNGRAGTLPGRVASAGQAMGRGTGQERGQGPDRRFKRHMSAVEHEYGREDYSQLNRVQQQHGFPNPSAVNRRGQSISSVFTSTPTSSAPQQQFPLARLDKRNSVTNYSRSSQSPTDSQNSMRPAQVYTPTSEAPPPYRSNSSSPYSPSGSSMLENGAYEGTNPYTQTVVVHEVSKSDDSMEPLELDQQQPWYHNTSDLSLEHNPTHHQTDVLGGAAITPYSQVSNSEIDSRRVQESSRVQGSVPRFSVSGNRAAPYSEPVSSVENLSRVHQTTSHFHTVVV